MPDLVPVADVEKMAAAVAKSGLFGVKTPEQAMALMLIAQAEGYHPAIAARDYHVISGRPTLKADAMLARFQASGGKVEWKEYTDNRVTGVFSHPQGGSVTLSWEIEQAKRIGLYKPGSGWEKYPRAMLRARVVSEGIRTVYPGCVCGTYTPEEVQDFSPPEKDITPPGTITVTTFDDLDSGKEIAATPSMSLDVHVPGIEGVYATVESVEQFEDAIVKVAQRIKGSERLSDDEKSVKLKELKELNKPTFKRIGLGEMTRILGVIAKVQGEPVVGESEGSES